METINKQEQMPATTEIADKAANMNEKEKTAVGEKVEKKRSEVKREILEKLPGKHTVSNTLQNMCEKKNDKGVDSYLAYKRPGDPKPPAFA